MSQSKITLLGMYNYDDSLFDLLKVPEGLNKETLVENILQESGDFEVLYSDFDFMKNSIGLVSRKWNRTFQKWWDALQLEYDPIYNYDRYEEWTDEGTDSGTVGNEGKSTSDEHSSGSGNTTTNVNSYDSNTFQPDGQSTSTQSASSGGVDTSNTTETRNLKTTGKHNGHLYGNIGVTTSQQMLESELELDAWNVYEHITDVFVKELCIMVY